MTYLEKQIELLGLKKVHWDYMTMVKDDFLTKYKCSYNTVIKKLGHKMEHKKRSQHTQYLVYNGSIRDGIKTDRWEQPKEDRYWEKKGFEVREMSHIKTSLL